jgi:MFS transporter, SHS family, lactate transporter
MFGPAAATALEDLPYDARGILSGLYQQGYGVGYLLAAAFYRALVPTTTHGWRSLFWFGAGPPVLIIIYRLMLPETNYFQILKAERETEHQIMREAVEHGEAQEQEKGAELKAFARSAWVSVKENWVLLIYMFVVMTGFNSVSHGSQDLFPTYMKDQLGFDADKVTIVSCVGQIGAVTGGTTIGWISSMTGRRLAMIVSCIIGGALVPAYIFTKNMDLVAATFFEQFFVGGVWGPIPVSSKATCEIWFVLTIDQRSTLLNCPRLDSGH